MNERIERTLSVLLTLAAVIIAASIAKREFFDGTEAASTNGLAASFVPQWRDALAVGIGVGDAGAAVRVIELSDLECPACRAFHRTVREVMKERSGIVSAVFVHYPLSQHRFAMAAARAVECAEAEGHFADLVAAIYEKQDSLGLRSWGSYAKEAGIADTTRIVKCASSSSRVSRIEQGIAYGNRLGVQFTPTIVVNGWRLGGTPSKTELIRIIEAIAGGHAPFDTAMKAGG